MKAEWKVQVAALLALGCGVSERATPTERAVPFACGSSSDCPAGSCLAEFGICTLGEGHLANLLFEITPQASDPVYGGARYLTIQDVSQAPEPGGRMKLNVRPRVPVTGQVTAAPELAACLSLARSTLPVTLTFTPREQLLGLSLPSYELSTTFDESPDVLEWVFRGSIPPGSYDVYMRPDINALGEAGEDCRAIPQIFRNRSVGLLGGEDDRLELQQPTPSALRLTITWSDSLEGWRLDMVHPVTGEVLSNRVMLHAADVDAATNTLVTTLDYSRAENDFFTGAEELVRLTPPEGVPAGTVLLQRSGLEIVNAGEGAIGNVSSFGAPVDFQAWVWKQGEADTPVPGTVSFAAIELDEVEEGVLASFEASADVDATGEVITQLLPGQYRVRVTPPGLDMPELGLMTGYESTVTVWPNGEPSLDRQGGHVIDVPPAVALSGHVVAESNGMPLRQLEVRASASNPERDLCPPAEDGSDAGSEATCERPRPPVLQRALAQDPFIPRTRNGLTGQDGEFTVDGLDCGRCDAEEPVLFDLTVRPGAASGLPWLIRSAIDPYADAEALAGTPLQVPMPVARPVRVTYGEEPSAPPEPPDVDAPPDEELRLSGALVRVFALLDNRGRLVTDPTGLVPCVSVTTSDGGTCLQSVLQVAEARTGSEGDFLLLLPPDVQ